MSNRKRKREYGSINSGNIFFLNPATAFTFGVVCVVCYLTFPFFFVICPVWQRQRLGG